MHQLTIAKGDDAITTPGFVDFEDAHRMLMCHAIGEDLYLQHNRAGRGPGSSSYSLIKLEGWPKLRPHVIGTATIEPEPGKPVVPPHQSAIAAQQWIADNICEYQHGSDTDPGRGYARSVLTTARAEARRQFRAGTIFDEAVRLSDNGNEDVPRPQQTRLEILRDQAINLGRNGRPLTPEELAEHVQRHHTPAITPQQTAALIWWTALLIWGATTP
ncbi:hypothetical protein [Mycolicibacterium mageritense]|uniref:hypothetical protein n=1 Tax=Mycolicibacterium mageritense TaxID=53462 RepID=UPI0011D43BD6|nr:hypothetical protein [Mycolicibacterium mageritense]TXI56482.1 MAG: hypothetical protein E6Q55_28875 [Mycolicibacterium mageritense]